ncbi:hydantoinase/oxoprolinase family protein [Pseudonocardia acaciae]|uniref:hydantoinase/oxoprolinase family protein n=1 Tax=Pseudonocardia acaciae TaxID=551276 RepID=UPI000490A76F|nr:hydantoinase/oxoprolinase family protein [Pseudonocardia acaciae]
MTASLERPYRVGVDIGGTFVDVVLLDTRNGRLTSAKRLSNPTDPASSALAGIDDVLDRASGSLADVRQVVHATTIGPNTIIQRTGARAAFLVTEGFGDLLQMQRQLRHNPYDLSYRRYEPLVPRERVFQVPQRTRADGSVHRPLDEAAVREIAVRLRELEVSAVAVCLLHSYADPADERRIREILGAELPEVSVSLSCEVAPLPREYERASTTVANAYIEGAYRRYLTRMERAMRGGGFAGGFYLMQANGGLATVAQVKAVPIPALESGPTAGAIMAAAHGMRAGERNVLCFDMGGTTAKAAACVDGEIAVANQFEVDRTLMRPGTGIPVLIPSLDLVEIGAGGGSIARANLGIVTVGPRSAGARPGPACYGNGGEHATVTDANLVLGYLNPDFFNGGQLGLDPAAAQQTVKAQVGSPLGLDTVEAAWGVHDAVTANMANAIRAVSLERGHDPRGFALVPSGGGGPLHASRIARALGIPKIVVPAAAGVLSAVGLLAADPRFDLARAAYRPLTAPALAEVDEIVAELRAEADARLDASGLPGHRTYQRALEMRYAGQGHEITVPVPDGAGAVASVLAAFEARYERLYGFAESQAPVEITSVRLTAQIPGSEVRTGVADGVAAAETVRPHARRPAYFPEAGGLVEVPVYRRAELREGATFAGPAIVEEEASTSLLLPGDRAVVDRRSNLVIEVNGASR